MEFENNLIRYLQDARHANKNLYLSIEDLAGQSKSFFITYLDQKLRGLCLNAEMHIDGVCDLTWKHEDCRVLMDILFELTEKDKYKSRYFYD